MVRNLPRSRWRVDLHGQPEIRPRVDAIVDLVRSTTIANGAIDAVCHIEPYATQCLTERAGSSVLTDGIDLYGAGYSDCVLAAGTPGSLSST